MERLIKTMDRYLKQAKAETLILRISREWFDKIVSGEKTEEYRAIKPYWVNRLVRHAESSRPHNEMEFKPFTHVCFINGYRKDSPCVTKKIEKIYVGKPKKGLCPDNWLETEFFIIKFN